MPQEYEGRGRRRKLPELPGVGGKEGELGLRKRARRERFLEHEALFPGALGGSIERGFMPELPETSPEGDINEVLDVNELLHGRGYGIEGLGKPTKQLKSPKKGSPQLNIVGIPFGDIIGPYADALLAGGAQREAVLRGMPLAMKSLADLLADPAMMVANVPEGTPRNARSIARSRANQRNAARRAARQVKARETQQLGSLGEEETAEWFRAVRELMAQQQHEIFRQKALARLVNRGIISDKDAEAISQRKMDPPTALRHEQNQVEKELEPMFGELRDRLIEKAQQERVATEMRRSMRPANVPRGQAGLPWGEETIPGWQYEEPEPTFEAAPVTSRQGIPTKKPKALKARREEEIPLTEEEPPAEDYQDFKRRFLDDLSAQMVDINAQGVRGFGQQSPGIRPYQPPPLPGFSPAPEIPQDTGGPPLDLRGPAVTTFPGQVQGGLVTNLSPLRGLGGMLRGGGGQAPGGPTVAGALPLPPMPLPGQLVPGMAAEPLQPGGAAPFTGEGLAWPVQWAMALLGALGRGTAGQPLDLRQVQQRPEEPWTGFPGFFG